MLLLAAQVWDVAQGVCLHTEQGAHSRRVKAIALLTPGALHVGHYFATGSSDGSITLWRLTVEKAKASLFKTCTIQTRLRITSLSVSMPDQTNAAGASDAAADRAATNDASAHGSLVDGVKEGSAEKRRQAGSRLKNATKRRKTNNPERPGQSTGHD
jgi:hypothetical protein